VADPRFKKRLGYPISNQKQMYIYNGMHKFLILTKNFLIFQFFFLEYVMGRAPGLVAES
jgi:hypothetical protein